MTSSQFSGQVTFVTSIDFEGDLGGHPSVGRMKITGLSNTSVTIDVVDDTEVDLLIDLNGDGSPDALVTVPWVSGVGL
jgi:hypothetical protein